MPWQHMWPTTLATPGWFSRSFISGLFQDVADAGCACKKCAPRLSCIF